ncbi:VOC family protein [Microbulbifer litoralis]|uniref:VOC family protein n=1 Tax=Microbulbifer litoralis TaxID=2933965 RepID=UPI0020286F0D|nr:VOC family protein [Microbulbifer sp. GX H0434]
MSNPFHLSFVVSDLEASKKFYTEVLGCPIGRDQGSWIDILFFGHQITIHKESEILEARSIDHFGPILSKNEWKEISDKCEDNEINFVLPPTVKNSGTENESGKYLIKDPGGNLLEFKYYGTSAHPMVQGHA